MLKRLKLVALYILLGLLGVAMTVGVGYLGAAFATWSWETTIPWAWRASSFWVFIAFIIAGILNNFYTLEDLK